MEKKNGRNGNNIISNIALISQFFLFMIVPIGGLSFGGYCLDKALGTNWMFIAGFFVGAIAGGNSIYRIAMKTAKQKQEEPERNIINRRSKENDLENNDATVLKDEK